MEVRKPNQGDLPRIGDILRQWTDEEEVEKYLERIQKEIEGETIFGMRFWVIEEDGQAVGVGGLADPLPKVKEFCQKERSVEIKILYLDNQARGKGYGKMFLDFLEEQAKSDEFEEIIVRSGKRYETTAWGFYEKYGYRRVGTVNVDMAVYWKEI